MTMSVVYSNFAGMVVSETRNGVESDYVSDPLGSTIGLMNSAGVMTDRWEYWPYGEVVSRTGTNPTPLTFLGVIGYFQDVLSKMYYVRARHFRPDLARWLTVDPVWPSQLPYGYSDNSPTMKVDPSGLSPVSGFFDLGHCSTLFYLVDLNWASLPVIPVMEITIRLCLCLDDYGLYFGAGTTIGAVLAAIGILLGLIIAGAIIAILTIVGAVLTIIFGGLVLWGAICYSEFRKQEHIGMEWQGRSIGVATYGTYWCTRCPGGR